MKLHITILKYHLWYLRQISLQTMLLPIHIKDMYQQIYKLLTGLTGKFFFVHVYLLLWNSLNLWRFHIWRKESGYHFHPFYLKILKVQKFWKIKWSCLLRTFESQNLMPLFILAYWNRENKSMQNTVSLKSWNWVPAN